jgi:hypothetical protein
MVKKIPIPPNPQAKYTPSWLLWYYIGKNTCSIELTNIQATEATKKQSGGIIL